MSRKIYLMTFVILGISMIGVTFNFFTDRMQFLQVAVGTEARILKHAVTKDSGKKYFPVLSFFDRTGKMYIIETERGYKEPKYDQDERVPILYDPNDPYRAIINTFLDKWGHTLMSGLFAIFIICFGIIAHRKYRGN